MQRVQVPQRSGGGRSGSIVEAHQQFAQEKPGAQRFVDQAGVPADPAEAGEAGVGALEQRRRVHADARFERGARAFVEQCVEPFEAAPQILVIVAAPGVA